LNFDFFGLFGSLSPELYWGGDQAAWWGSMAVSVIVGIMFATFLTLILVPVMYSLVDDFTAFFRRHYSSKGQEGQAEEVGSQEADLPAEEGVPGFEPTPEPEPAPATPESAPEPNLVSATAVQVLEADGEPAPLGDRLRSAAPVGAALGSLLGVVLALAASPLLLDRATVIREEPFGAGVEVTLTWLIVVTAVASALFGSVIAMAARLVPGWLNPAMTLRGSTGASAWLGALVGAVLGAIGAPILSGLAGETIETGIVLSVRATFLVLLVGGALLGAFVAAVVQLIGEPEVLPAEVEEESTVVKRRLAGGILIPLAGLGAIALLVLPFALLLLQYHSAAPALALAAAGGILSFAFLAAYRPGLRVTRGEFILAAAGIGIVLLIIVLAYLYLFGPEEGHSEEVEALLRWVLT
jgi:MFS family permease